MANTIAALSKFSRQTNEKFRVTITGDINQESGVGEVIFEICGPTGTHFKEMDYGSVLSGVCVVLMCRDPDLNFKRRVRYSRVDKMVYMDIMLDLHQMLHAKHDERKRIILERLSEEVPVVLHKYSILGFDEIRFVADFRSWLQKLADSLAS